jgi:hypothetical protein
LANGGGVAGGLGRLKVWLQHGRVFPLFVFFFVFTHIPKRSVFAQIVNRVRRHVDPTGVVVVVTTNQSHNNDKYTPKKTIF